MLEGIAVKITLTSGCCNFTSFACGYDKDEIRYYMYNSTIHKLETLQYRPKQLNVIATFLDQLQQIVWQDDARNVICME